jgi:hypothetical protein
MQMIFSVVFCKGIFVAVEGEFPLCDSVSISADESAEIGGVLDVFSEGIVSEYDVIEIAVSIGSF